MSKSLGRDSFQIHSNPNQARSQSQARSTKNNTTKDLKRQKLKDILIEKFTKKFGIKAPLPFLNEEISNFLNENNLTERDLKKLEEKLSYILTDMQNQESLRNNLTTEQINSQKNIFKDQSQRNSHLNQKSSKSI